MTKTPEERAWAVVNNWRGYSSTHASDIQLLVRATEQAIRAAVEARDAQWVAAVGEMDIDDVAKVVLVAAICGEVAA